MRAERIIPTPGTAFGRRLAIFLGRVFTFHLLARIGVASALVIYAGEELDKVDGFIRRICTNGKTIAATHHITRIASTTFDSREIEEAQSVTNSLAAFTVLCL